MVETGTFAARLVSDGERAPLGAADQKDVFAGASSGGGPILVPGRNCWRIPTASQATVLIDAAAYYGRLRQALQAAEHSVLIIGWDFDHRIHLEPEDGPALGEFLRALVEAKPDLRIRVLIWSFAPIHGPGSGAALLFGARWHDHPRIELRLDRAHAFYACHHQKIVCIDDRIAFTGGMDLTADRWDDRRHAVQSRRRIAPDGEPYPPVHDVQMLVTGDAAGEIARLGRDRWEQATGQVIAAAPRSPSTPPESPPADFAHVPIGIARGGSVAIGEAAAQEVAALTVDVIAAARRWLYIETQYLTSQLVGEALVRSLAAPTGPEIVILLTRRSSGLLEHLFMGKNRDRLLRILAQADRHHRLRCYYPVVPGPKGARPVKIHSKVMIADDRLLRIGSTNLNNRSMHVDSECDLAIETGKPAEQRRIAEIRNRLLAEHLGATAERVAAILDETGSLFAAIDRLNHRPRGLRPFDHISADGPTRPMPFTWLLDPSRRIGR